MDRIYCEVFIKINELGQPIGDALPHFKPGELPKLERIEGRYAVIERLSKDKHGADLYEVYGSVQSQDEWSALLDQMLAAPDRFYYAIVDKESGKALGTFALMRIDRGNRVIEAGSVTYSPKLKRTRLATEAQYLLARYVFEELEYRRYEWKCDALNQPSRRAAERLGFTYEGTFRQAVVYKGRNRDTDWLAMIDRDWPAVKTRLEKWLSPDNFDENGQQIKALSDF